MLVLVPDATRTAPLPLLFDALWIALVGVSSAAWTCLIALGTHPPLTEAQIGRLLGIDGTSRRREVLAGAGLQS